MKGRGRQMHMNARTMKKALSLALVFAFTLVTNLAMQVWPGGLFGKPRTVAAAGTTSSAYGDRPMLGIINYSGLTGQNKTWDERSLTPPQWNTRLPFYAIREDDESRLARTENTVQEIVYYSETDITNVRIYAAFDDTKPYDITNDIKILTSDDGITYTEAPSPGLSGKSEYLINGAVNWQKVNISSSYEFGIHYIKIQLAKSDDTPLNPQIMRIEYWVMNEARDNLIRIVDDMDGYSKMHSHSAGLTFASDQKEKFSLVAADDNEPEIVAQQIAYAKSAHIDYIAFLDMETNWHMTKPRTHDLFRQSPDKGELKYCMIYGSALSGNETWGDRIERTLEYFADEFYVRVLGNRPLLYVMNLLSETNWPDVQNKLSQLRQASIEAGLGDPYIVGMGGHTWDSHLVDAASDYAAIESEVVYHTDGYNNTIPLISLGVNDEPRHANPPSWGAWGPTEAPVANEKITEMIDSAFQWTVDNPAKNPANTVLMYAWNEHAEAASNVEPTLNADGSINTRVLDTIGDVLKEWDENNPLEPIEDDTPPTVPGSLSFSQTGRSTAVLTWSAASDNIRVTGYNIYNNGTLIGTSKSTAYTAENLALNTEHVFTVRARDAAGNLSDSSEALNFTTDAVSDNLIVNPGFEDGIEPYYTFHATLGLTTVARTGSNAASLTDRWPDGGWQSARQDVTEQLRAYGPGTYSFGGYLRYVQDSGPLQVFLVVKGTGDEREIDYTIDSINAGTVYTEARGNWDVSWTGELESATVMLNTGTNGADVYVDDYFLYVIGAGGADEQAPTAPENLSATEKTTGSIKLSWSAASDNVAVTGYDIYCDGVYAGSTDATMYTVHGLLPDTLYEFTVVAKDWAGNVSAPSSPLSARTQVETEINLLSNPGFESGTTGWSSMGGSFDLSGDPRTGAAAARVTRTDFWERIECDITSILHTYGPGVYRIGMHAKYLSGSDKAYMLLTGNSIWMATWPHIEIGGSYTEVSGLVRIHNTSDLSNVKLGFQTDAGGSMDVDDFFVYYLSDDLVPPADITDLSVTEVTDTTATLSWTAPGDNGNEGTASQYEIYYATTPDGDSTMFADPPAPLAAGSTQTVTITGLQPGTTYYFHIVTGDAVGNYSGESNKPSITTTNSIQDNLDIGAAKTEIEAAFPVDDSQENIGSPTDARNKVEALIVELSLNGVSTSIVDDSFTAAQAGTADNLAGTDGWYTFTVTLNKGAGTEAATEVLTLNITATPYEELSVNYYSITVQTGGNGTADASVNSAAQGTEIILTATPQSSYQFKEWQVVSGGVSIANNKFIMPAANVTIQAIFEPVPAASYTVTVNGSYADTTGAGSYEQGAMVTIYAGSRSNYSFTGWTSPDGVSFTNAGSATTTFTVPAKNVSVTANWSYNGDETGGTPSTPTTPSYNADVKVGENAEKTIPVIVDKDAGTASIDAGSQNLIPGGTVIKMPSIPDIEAYSVGIPISDLSTTVAQGTLTLNTDKGSVTVPSNMLTGIAGISGSKAQVTIGQGNRNDLPADVKADIGDRPLVQLTLAIDGKQTVWSNPAAHVTVSIPYTPTAAELANPESIIIWYIDGSGHAVAVSNGHYDRTTGTVTFTTTHFSNYAVGYNRVSFTDVASSDWFSEGVSFIAARKITAGTGNEKYSPNAKLTRGEFVVMLLKAFNIAPDSNWSDNFTDAGNTYYTGYLAAAKRLGISGGVGNNMFAPGKQMTRQEMFTLLYNALKIRGQLPQGDSGKTLDQFTDAGQIDFWAKDAMTLLVKAGTISGSGGKLTPTGTATRAEMAQMLYNLLGK